ncbi:MAG: hypothetical protein WDN28_19830 [Chthoniobacter sp.]
MNALYEEAFKNDGQVTFCDTWSLFDDGTGSCKKEEFPDMLHPNAIGYAKWTATLQPIFDRLGAGEIAAATCEDALPAEDCRT